MKQNKFYTTIATSILLAFTIMINSVSANAENIDTNTIFETSNHQDFAVAGIPHPPLNTPKTHAKYIEEKINEIENRLNLSQSQKDEIKKIKEKEAQKLAPTHKKIREQEKKLGELFDKERKIRKETLVKFNKILSKEQQAELEKIKKEALEEMKNFAPPQNMFKNVPPTVTPVNYETENPQEDCDCDCHKKELTPKSLTKPNEEITENTNKTIENKPELKETTKDDIIEQKNTSIQEQVIKAEDNVLDKKVETTTETQTKKEEIKNINNQMPLHKHEKLQLLDRCEIINEEIKPPSFPKEETIQKEIKLENTIF